MAIDFQKAIEISMTNAKSLLPKANNFELEGIILNDHSNFEVTLSYIVDHSESYNNKMSEGSIGFIMAALARKREEKVFIVDKSGNFKGFKNVK
ncbi:hypothetical protein [Acinetobacter soli]|uniref:hypothetical protein n=1 Tax=Acinetobacter soli TaxID=487316 RepID=UPI000CE30ECB|nr:hypothetical protein [Acinetobacter soli]PPB87733.1 hypothetical protein AsoHEU7_03360 [Acinetobacter soli]